jgi:hypothetical protein
MGRIADLCGEIATDADEGPDGLTLPPDTLDRLREAGWSDEDIADGVEVVRASFMQNELVDLADSLSARLVEVLGALGTETAFRAVAAGEARLSLDVIAQLVRRVARLEQLLDPLREGSPVDRRAFDALEHRLAEQGIEPSRRRDPPAGSLRDAEE